jgi:hypothetical protein
MMPETGTKPEIVVGGKEDIAIIACEIGVGEFPASNLLPIHVKSRRTTRIDRVFEGVI